MFIHEVPMVGLMIKFPGGEENVVCAKQAIDAMAE
jgi:hypothetical protein